MCVIATLRNTKKHGPPQGGFWYENRDNDLSQDKSIIGREEYTP